MLAAWPPAFLKIRNPGMANSMPLRDPVLILPKPPIPSLFPPGYRNSRTPVTHENPDRFRLDDPSRAEHRYLAQRMLLSLIPVKPSSSGMSLLVV